MHVAPLASEAPCCVHGAIEEISSVREVGEIIHKQRKGKGGDA